MLSDLAATKTTKEWVDALAEAGVPGMHINSLEEVVSDPHLADVGFWVETDHPTEGRIRLMRPPYTLSKTPPDIRTLAPSFGQHTAEVLTELGYSEAQIAAMLEAGAAMGERA